jgi:hypothetical protein
MKSWIVQFGLLLMLCVHIRAQLNRSTLTGFVSDSSGAAIVNAKVKAVHTATNAQFSTATTETGNYTLPALDIGEYRVEVEAPGFKRAVRQSVTLESGASARVDFKLEVGEVTELVEVSARAAAIETESTRIATNLTSKLVEDLPLVVSGQIRNVFNLALIAPEAKTGGNTSGQFRIGGGETAGWDMTMDGSSVTSASTNYQYERAPISSAPVDAISEFTVTTSGMKAEYGRAMGVISFATKSGTNQIHGNVFEFLRNSAADARGFFAASTPVLKQSDFGGTLGGPVWIPKLYNGKNKTFFFGSYEGFRNRSGSTPTYSTIPLPEMYNGDFSGWTNKNGIIPIFDPASTTLTSDGKTYTRTAFPGDRIPMSQFSQVAKNYIALRPTSMVPNVPDAGPTLNYFTSQGGTIQPWDKGTIRVDHQWNSNNHFSFLYLRGERDDDFLNGQPPGLPNPLNGNSVWTRKNSSGRFSWDRTISTRIVNSMRISYQQEHGTVTAIDSVNPDDKWNSKLEIKNTPGPDRALPGLTFSQYTGWSGNAWGGDYGRDFNFNNDVTIVKGSHTFKTGFFLSIDHWWGVGQHRPNGDFSFSYLATAIPGDQSQNTGNAFAAFLLGYPDRTGLETPRAVLQTWSYFGGFFQDDWKVTNKLTLNLGLRWEYTTPVGGGALLNSKSWESLDGENGGFENFDPSVPNPAAEGRLGAVVYSGNCQVCTGKDAMFNGYKHAFGPRLGLAYQVRPGTVVRLYSGRSFGAVKTTGGSTHYDGLILNTNWSSQDRDIIDFPTLLDKGLPAWTPPPFRDPTVDNNAVVSYWQTSDTGRPPEYFNWGLDIQQQLPRNLVASVSYSATKGVHLNSALLNLDQLDPKYLALYGQTLLLSNINSPAARAANIPIPYAGFNSSVSQALRSYPQYSDVQTNGSSVGERAGNSNYQSMIAKLDKRYSSGLTLLFSYVLSKFVSDADASSITGRQVVDQYNRHLEKALSADDQTHVFRVAYTYDLPIGKGKALALSGIMDKLLGNWTFAGFLSYESGTPLGVSPGINPLPTAGNRVSIASYGKWRAPATNGSFDPFKDVWWSKSAFGVDMNGNPLSPAALNSFFGNATRNNPKARSPWLLNENISLAKVFKVKERLTMTLRAEAFDVLNRVRWGVPDSTVTSSTFGIVRSQGNTPRQIQFGLKAVF